MRILRTALIVFALFLGNASGAQTPDSKFFFRGLDYYFTYFLAPKLVGEAKDNTTEYDVSFTGPGLSRNYIPAPGLRYDYIRNDGFGFYLGARYEPNRVGNSESKSKTGSESTVKNLGNYSFLLIEPSLTKSIDGAYFILGLNYPFSLKDGLTGDLGGQIGFGWDWGNNISNIKFEDARVNFEFLIQSVQFDFDDLNGLNGSGHLTGVALKLGFNFQ